MGAVDIQRIQQRNDIQGNVFDQIGLARHCCLAVAPQVGGEYPVAIAEMRDLRRPAFQREPLGMGEGQDRRV